MEEWASRNLQSDDTALAMRANDMQLGGVKVLTKMLEVTHEDIEHFYQLTGGVGEFQYSARRENKD